MAEPYSVDINQDDLAEVRSLIDRIKGNTKLAQVRAFNKGVKGSRKLTVDTLNARLNLTKTKIRERTNIRLATQATLSAKLIIASGGIPLFQYSGTRAGKRGVGFRIWRNEARERYDHAFKADMKSGHTGIFERNLSHTNYDGRLPLREKMGPGVATVFQKEKRINQEVGQKAGDIAIAELNRQLQLILDKKI